MHVIERLFLRDFLYCDDYWEMAGRVKVDGIQLLEMDLLWGMYAPKRYGT